jgi:hypothetical protein
MKQVLAAVAVAAMVMGGAAQAKDNTAAILGGVAAGALGGVVLGNVLSNHQAPPPPPAPVPTYVRPAPTVEVIEPAPRPVVRTVVASPYDDEAYGLKEACDNGSKRACIRFGIMIGKHQERVATWRRTHPDFFSYED